MNYQHHPQQPPYGSGPPSFQGYQPAPSYQQPSQGNAGYYGPPSQLGSFGVPNQPQGYQPPTQQPYYGNPSASGQYFAQPGYAAPGISDVNKSVPGMSSIPPQDRTGKGSIMLSTRPKYQDIWATILFVLQIIAFIVLAAIFIGYLVRNSSGNGSSPIDPTTRDYYIYVLLGMTGGSLLFTLGYMGLCYAAPQFMIHFTFLLTIGLYGAAAGWTGYLKLWGATVLFAVLALIHILFYFFWRNRIPLAALLLKTVMDVISIYPATLVLPAITLVLQMGFSVAWGMTITGMEAKYNSVNYGVLVYLLFSFYWTTQVIKNTTHVTTAGLFASYYFLHGTELVLANPTLHAFKRAISYAFGSICFGSLIVALIQTLRAVVRMAARNDSIIGACLDCILSAIESLVEYFNYYAYIQVAIYGKPFCTAAKDTWSLVKSCGIDIIVNDDFIGTVLSFGIFFCGAICGVIAYVITSNANLAAQHIAIITASSCVIGWVFMIVATEVISSGVATTFVCLAEDPAALARTKPELYAKIQSVYPEVRMI